MISAPNIGFTFYVIPSCGHLMSVIKFSIATQEESSLYGDILQEGFVDSYANLSVKSLMLAKWFTQVRTPYPLHTS